jgi:hypothetical protein
LLIPNDLKDILNADIPLSKEEADNVRFLTEEEISDLFERSVIILQECTEMTYEEAREHRTSALKLVKADFLKLAQANRAKRVDFVRFPANLPEDYLPPVGSIAHLALHDVGDPNSCYTFPSDLDLEKQGFTPYPKTPVYEKLYSILRTFSRHANEDDPVEIRIVLAGDDALIHRFVCAYMCIVTEQPDVLIGVVFRIFVVPFQRSAIAGYIARYDAWYQ